MCTWLSLLTGLSSPGSATSSPGAPLEAAGTSCCLPLHTELPLALRVAGGPWDLPSEDLDTRGQCRDSSCACVLKLVPRSHCSVSEI